MDSDIAPALALTAADGDSPRVVGRPPRILLGFIAAGIVLDLVWPMPFLPGALQYWLGGSSIVLGLALFAWACRALRQAGTNIPTCQPAIRIVGHGPYRLSRNPIYLSMATVFLGIATAVDGPWLFGLFLVWLPLMKWGVIRREEAYLDARFGDAYRAYKLTARRWL